MQKSVTDKYSSANVVLKQIDEMGTLLIGDCTSAVDKHILKPYKILTIITIGLDSAPEKKQQDINYILHNILDNKSQKISNMFDEVFVQIQQARKRGGVLVHCFTGISRSSSFVIAYLMRKKFMSYDDSKAFLKKQRNLIQPNDNFHRQLQNYWKVLLKREQQERLKRTKVEQKKEKQIENNQSQIISSNLSNICKRTLRGVKGAVKPAIRQNKSLQTKSIQQKAQKSIEKQPVKIQTNQSQCRDKSFEKIKKQQKAKQVKGVYSNKTKVI